MENRSSDKDDFICCSNCGKKFFKLNYGGGEMVVFCRGCHKEVTVPFGSYTVLGKFADSDGS
ncbi:MAG: hypothetical protein IKB02_04580 [Clostridia bacterium]|nr:hypothetical protein [Clostridia bacterium]